MKEDEQKQKEIDRCKERNRQMKKERAKDSEKHTETE